MERYGLSNQIQEEEKKVANFDSWVKSWVLANRYREFIVALEKVWAEAGHDLTTEGEKGKRLLWMKPQADRLDPLVASPPSILDRKSEVNRY
jgi:alkanesulfonate monooxygenase SsuD/methylene tetrahydromethanopterin reductase-like flavin-dependent oxidoreductase (luciferase family)